MQRPTVERTLEFQMIQAGLSRFPKDTHPMMPPTDIA